MHGAGRRRFRCLGTAERAARSQGYPLVAGVDEAGRGSLFGPVYAAAVILDPARPVRGLRDSKDLQAGERRELAGEIRRYAVAWSVAAVDAFVIDHVNIYEASRLAMRRAVEQLAPPPDYLLADAFPVDLPLPQKAIIHGDARCRAIAAASILAKVHRDECMMEWDRIYPQYGFRHHKGYATPEHSEALAVYGPTVHHRFSYQPVREYCPRSLRLLFSLRSEMHFRWEPA